MNATSQCLSQNRRERSVPGARTGIPPWKRALDIAVVLAALPVLLPVMAVVAGLVRLVSRGPVIFRQERMGLRGRPFMCLKFRTMVLGNHAGKHEGHLRELMESNKPLSKMERRGDSRIIPLGNLLRASGLDELPQIFNVLRGDMSLVGPRPCMRYEFERYKAWQRERFNAVPGLTGLWQVSGKNRTTFEEMIRLDVEYCRNQSVWLDCKIMLRTIPALWFELREAIRGERDEAQVAAEGGLVSLSTAGMRAGRGFATVSFQTSLPSGAARFHLRN
jgi:lipopolysaccharide/colanic/teichoic acid biosynthesis glycosyltransferase